MRRRFVTLDVFCKQRFAGNPLAVVLEPDGLDDRALQSIAREFNLSETVFVFPAATPANRASLRIFTPAAELPFAGHPTIGTAVLLGLIDGGHGPRDYVLEEGVGPVRCAVEIINATRGRARFDVPRPAVEIGTAPDPAHLAAALSLSIADIGFDNVGPECWTAGVPMIFVPLRDLDAVRRCRVDLTHWEEVGPPGAVFVFCRETLEPGHAFHARMFAPGLGVPEDPATGSAAAAFSGMLARFSPLSEGDHVFVVEQGYEMGRPSLIELHLTIRDERLIRAAVAGEAILVSEGTIEA